ncbi:MAG: LysR family transcriptional regulator, partial [Pseudomonadota bacterium]
MRHLNYNHLQYFWVVAREGTIARAAESLHVTPQTISGQIKLLEDSIGEALFERSGRRLALTTTGQTVFDYADVIFSVGAELAQVVRSNKPGVARQLRVGIVESIPKLAAARIIAPAFAGDDAPRIRCIEGPLPTLLGELAVHKLDLVLSDEPTRTDLSVRVYNHSLGTSAVGFFAHSSIAPAYEDDFPASLNGAPLLLP